MKQRLAGVGVTSVGAILVVTLLGGCGSSSVKITAVSGTPDSTRLGVSVDSCGRNAAVSAQESADRVSLSAHEDRQAPWVGHADCLDLVWVTLKEPVGQRKIVDTSTGEAVPLQAD